MVLNIEADHLDFFKDLADIQNSFHAFASRVPEDGLIIANLDDTSATISQFTKKRTFILRILCAAARNLNLISSITVSF